MNRRDFVSVLVASLASRTTLGRTAQEIPIILSADAPPLVKFAAAELAKYLRNLFPACAFSVVERPPQGGSYIRLGTLQDSPQLSRFINPSDVAHPDSFVIKTAREGQAPVGIIAGADPRGALFGVYALLEKLGYGFYLSYDAPPEARSGPFNFDGWQLADSPLVAERIVFNWHNFLSGCSGWALADWQKWIDQAAKMRFASIMVHAYGNNPMVSFTYNGQTKPTGFLTTSAYGRDWGNEHVNDVRRIWGGGGIFQAPVFGSPAGQVPPDETVEAAASLMKQVFEQAHRRGLKVDFALDMDTDTANPQNIIRTLPEAARIRSGRYLLANPDTPEGYAYYESQVRQLLATYPQIDRLVLWFRDPATPTSAWCNLGRYSFPEPWQVEFLQFLEKHPYISWNDQLASLFFALNKLVEVYRKSLNSLGKERIPLALGNWEYWFVRTADLFMSPDVGMMCIHQASALGDEDAQNTLREVGAHRKVMVLPYAQDDDQGYNGRPYLPPPRLTSWLERSGCAGYGILHWTTRPLDVYFKSLSTQVWKNSRDESLEETCQGVAEHTFGKAARASGGTYLLRWSTEAPMFGRETGDSFMDRRSLPLASTAEIAAGCRERLQILDQVPAPRSAQGAAWLAYYRDHERFIMDFFASHSAWALSVKAAEAGDLRQAREQIARSKPEAVIELYAHMVSRLEVTSGDKGLLVSLNLRWLPYIVSERQALGLDVIRWKFEPTEGEPLAMGPGKYTYFFDKDHHLWRGLGEKEIGQPCFAKSDTPEDLADAWLEIQKNASLSLKCIMGEPLLKATYNARLLFLPATRQDTQASVEFELRGSDHGQAVKDRIDLHPKSVNESGLIEASRTLEIDQGFLQLDLRPVAGQARMCGVVLEPAAA
jgi:hypothetical protein